MELKPGYKQTEVGVIPEDWEVVEISQVAERITVGFVGSMAHLFTNNGVPLLRGQNVQPNKLNLSDTKFISTVTHKLWSKSVLKPGDVVLVRVGYPGTSCVIPEDLGQANAASLVLIRPSIKKLDANFLSFIINSDFGKRQIDSYLVGGAQQVLNTSTAAIFKLPLPKKAEQQAIAKALSDADALIESLEQLIAKKRHLKQGTVQDLLTGKKRLPGFTGEWEVKRLRDLADMGSGGTPLSSVADFYDGDIPWVSISDMTKGGKVITITDKRLTSAGYDNCAAQMFPAGTILYALYASLGECSIAGVPLCSSQAILGIRTRPSLNGEFLYYFLTSIKSTVRTMGQHGTQANLNKGMVESFLLHLPSIPEQTTIATILSDMDVEIAALEAKLVKIRQLKQGMMHNLLNGRIRLV